MEVEESRKRDTKHSALLVLPKEFLRTSIPTAKRKNGVPLDCLLMPATMATRLFFFTYTGLTTVASILCPRRSQLTLSAASAALEDD